MSSRPLPDEELAWALAWPPSPSTSTWISSLLESPPLPASAGGGLARLFESSAFVFLQDHGDLTAFALAQDFQLNRFSGLVFVQFVAQVGGSGELDLIESDERCRSPGGPPWRRGCRGRAPRPRRLRPPRGRAGRGARPRRLAPGRRAMVHCLSWRSLPVGGITGGFVVFVSLEPGDLAEGVGDFRNTSSLPSRTVMVFRMVCLPSEVTVTDVSDGGRWFSVAAHAGFGAGVVLMRLADLGLRRWWWKPLPNKCGDDGFDGCVFMMFWFSLDRWSVEGDRFIDQFVAIAGEVHAQRAVGTEGRFRRPSSAAPRGSTRMPSRST